MEHRSLTEPGALLVRSNALATYLGLVGSVEGATVTKPHGITLVRGPGFFSFCNFAAGFELGAEDVGPALDLLVEQARECFGFYVFSMSGDEPADLTDRMVERGFAIKQRLVGMASESAGCDAPLSRAVIEPGERRQVAAFMARQFFWQMPKEGREAIAAATAAGPHTLWCVGTTRSPEAAVMLVEQPASVGLFNLCVRPDLRRRGIGSRVVRQVQAAAGRLGRPVVLQCEPELEGWYRRLGFKAVGTVCALSLSHEESGDILSG